MKNFLFIILYLLTLNKVFSAEFTIEGYGTDENVSLFNYGKKDMFIVWKGKFQNSNNMGVRSVGECAGTIQIINGQQKQNVMCENRNKYGKFNFTTGKASGDDVGTKPGNANTQHFIIVGGTGVWSDFVGVRCVGAYFSLPESHFMWKGKCNIPDALMSTTKDKIANFKQDS